MSVLIKGMEMPKDGCHHTICVYADGTVSTGGRIYTAVPVPPHGRLIDVDYANVVPVVRCKDCKYRPIDTGTHQYGHELEFPNEYKCPCQCGDNWYSWMPDGEWFCANGERRTNG